MAQERPGSLRPGKVRVLLGGTRLRIGLKYLRSLRGPSRLHPSEDVNSDSKWQRKPPAPSALQWDGPWKTSNRTEKNTQSMTPQGFLLNKFSLAALVFKHAACVDRADSILCNKKNVSVWKATGVSENQIA